MTKSALLQATGRALEDSKGVMVRIADADKLLLSYNESDRGINRDRGLKTEHPTRDVKNAILLKQPTRFRNFKHLLEAGNIHIQQFFDKLLFLRFWTKQINPKRLD